MELARLADGSLRIRESFRFLRGGLALLALAGACGIGIAATRRFGVELAAREWMVLVGVTLACTGSALAVPTTEFVFEASARRVAWRRARLASARAGSIPFSELRGVRVESETSRGESWRPTATYRVWLDTSSGTLPLGYLDQIDAKRCEEIAAEIREIAGLGAPGSAAPDPIAALVAGGRSVEAVQRVRELRRCSLEEARRVVRELEVQKRER